MKFPRMVALGAAGVATVLLAGCGQSQAGAAITYDGGRITENEVAAQADEVANALGIAMSPLVTQATIERLAANTIVAAGAEQLGVSVNGGEVDQVLESAAAEVGGVEQLELGLQQQGVPLSAIPQQAEVAALATKMTEQLAPDANPLVQQEALNQYLVRVGQEINLKVNPRFGTWEPAQLALLPPSDLLSRPADNGLILQEPFQVN